MAATNKVWVNNSPPTCEDDDLNGFKLENNNLILGSDQVLNTGDNQQTNRAVSVYAAGADFYADSGVADAYVLAAGGPRIAPPVYFEGMRVRFLPGNSNTGASTINVAGLGVISLFFGGSDSLKAGLIEVEIQVTLIILSDGGGGWEGHIIDTVALSITKFDTVAEMVSDGSLIVGQIVETIGYSAVSDRGGNQYLVGTGLGGADGGRVIDLTASGNQALGLFPNGINALQFGAAADSGATDNLPIFQAAHDAFPGSVAVKVPDVPNTGDYYGVTGTFVISRDGFEFYGESVNAIIRTSSATLNIINMQGTAAHIADLRNAKVKNLTFQGTGGGSTARAINLDRCHECEVSGNRFDGDANKIGYGIYLDGTATRDVDNNIIVNNQIVRVAVTGIVLSGAAGACEENTVIGNVLTGCGGNGISCTGDKNTIIGNTIEESALTNIVVTGESNTITGNTSGQAIAEGIDVSGDFNTVTGNTVVSNGGDGIRTSGSGLRNALIGNSCFNNTGFGISNPSGNPHVILGNLLSGNTGGSRQINRNSTALWIGHNFDTVETPPHHIIQEREDAILTVNSSGTSGVSSGVVVWDLDNDVTVPVNATAIVIEVRMQDSGGAAGDANIRFLPNDNLVTGAESIIRAMPANDRWNSGLMVVPFDVTNNQIQVTITATGAGTMDYEVRLVGWTLE